LSTGRLSVTSLEWEKGHPERILVGLGYPCRPARTPRRGRRARHPSRPRLRFALHLLHLRAPHVGRRRLPPEPAEPKPYPRQRSAEPEPAESDPRRRGRYVPHKVRRAVWERDGARCSYVDPTAQRCRETGGLELDHVFPHARGGLPTVENLRLRCPAHNALGAEAEFGREFMAWKRGVRQSRTGRPKTGQPSGHPDRPRRTAPLANPSLRAAQDPTHKPPPPRPVVDTLSGPCPKCSKSWRVLFLGKAHGIRRYTVRRTRD